MAGAVGWEALPESQRPRPGNCWTLGIRQVLPVLFLTHPGKQSCCHENPELALGPSSPGHPSLCSTLFFHRLSKWYPSHQVHLPQEVVYPSFLPSLALLDLGTTHACSLPWSCIFPHQPFPLGVFLVSGILLGSLKKKKKKDFCSQIISGNTKWLLFCRTCQSL